MLGNFDELVERQSLDRHLRGLAAEDDAWHFSCSAYSGLDDNHEFR
jgi:hypothetical protein